MSEWTALLERLQQIGAYFAGTEGPRRAAPIKRTPGEPERAEDAIPATDKPADSPREAAERLLRAITPDRAVKTERLKTGGGQERFDNPDPEIAFRGLDGPGDPADLLWDDRMETESAFGADLQAISRAFRRDARRYDE